MQTDEHRDDVRAIEALVTRQSASLTWAPGTSADWDAFAADFFPEASLYPSARPARRQTVEARTASLTSSTPWMGGDFRGGA